MAVEDAITPIHDSGEDNLTQLSANFEDDVFLTLDDLAEDVVILLPDYATEKSGCWFLEPSCLTPWSPPPDFPKRVAASPSFAENVGD